MFFFFFFTFHFSRNEKEDPLSTLIVVVHITALMSR